MLGIEISERTVSRILQTLRRPPTQTWNTFLYNHLDQLVSIEFFTVPTITMRVLFVFIVLEHHRRELLHFNVTEHPTGASSQQIVEAFADRAAQPDPEKPIQGPQHRSLTFSLPGRELKAKGGVLNRNGLMPAHEESNKSKDDWHVSRLFVFIRFQVNLLQADGIMAKNNELFGRVELRTITAWPGF
jgi:hypothetical protein